MDSRVAHWLRLTWHDLLAIAAFSLALCIANTAGDVSWPVSVGTLVAPLTLGVWQIRQANISESVVRERIRSELATRNRELCEANIVEALRQAVRIMIPGDDNPRANIMLIDDDSKLFIAYHFNMAGAPDLNMRFDKYQGCAGHAWALGDQAFADLEGEDDSELTKTWKLTSEQIALTRNIKSMVCTPVRHPRNRDTVVGVFSVDSTQALAQTTFDSEETAEEALAVSELIARLLVTGGII